MRPGVRTVVLRTTAVLAGAAALGGAFTGGVVAGRASDAEPATNAGTRLDEAAAQIEAQALRPVNREALDAAAVRAMLEAAGDDWGTWSSNAPSRSRSTDLGYVGVGVWLQPGPSGSVVVERVASGSSAEREGVRVGDEVRGVDGRSTQGMAAPAVAAALRGQSGTAVTVLVRRGVTIVPLRLERTAVPDAAVSVVHEQVAGGPRIGRIVVPAFHRGTGREVREALTRLREEQVAGVLLDLRGNPGGLLDEAVETASAFLDGGEVVTYTRRSGEPHQLEAVGTGDTALPLVVLVDGGTASSGEVVAGSLQDRERAVLVGSRTFGKGSVQEPRSLSDGSSLALTVAHYTTPSGRSPEGVGILPDLEVAAGSPPEVAVRRGIEALTGLVAAASPSEVAPAGGR